MRDSGVQPRNVVFMSPPDNLDQAGLREPLPWWDLLVISFGCAEEKSAELV